MNTIPPNVAGKLANLVRLLSSDKDGEALGAARAIGRTLQRAGLDIHVLAARVETGGQLDPAEMKEIFEAGRAVGLEEANNKNSVAAGFHDVDAVPLHEMALRCQRQAHRLRPNERMFVDDMAARTVWRSMTEKQEKWLRSIYLKLGGSRDDF